MDFACILSALLFFMGNLLKLIYFGKEMSRDFSWSSYKKLEPETLENNWDFLFDNKAHLAATSVLTSLAWFVFCFPMMQLVYVLHQSQIGSVSRSLWLHSGIVILVLGGSFMEWIANFLFLSSTEACMYMYNHFNLQTWTDTENDMIGLRSLELVVRAIQGMVYWVDAFEWIALSVIMLFTYISVVRHQRMNRGSPLGGIWNSLGLFIAILSLLDFTTEILRTVSWKVFSDIAFWYGAVNRMLLLPAWLIVLGWKMPRALVQLDDDNDKKDYNDNNQQQNSIDPFHQVEEASPPVM